MTNKVEMKINNKELSNKTQQEVMFKLYGSALKVWAEMGVKRACFDYTESDSGKLHVRVSLDGLFFEERLIGPKGKIYAK